MAKLLFIDVDGTLVDYENHLPDSAVKAIQLARKNGHKVYICTGRSKAEVYQNIWDIGLDGMIGGNGSYVEADNQVVLHQVLSKEQSKRIVDWLQFRGLEYYLESNNGLFASKNFAARSENVLREYMKRKGNEKSNQITVYDIFPEMIFDGELYRDDLNKVSYILDSYQDFQDTMQEFPDLQSGTWGGKGEEALFGDLGIKGINKAYAIESLLNYLGSSASDTIAFGDAKVDIPMFEFCAFGVAMGSGGAEIKEAANYITDDVDKDGLYKAFQYLELI